MSVITWLFARTGCNPYERRNCVTYQLSWNLNRIPRASQHNGFPSERKIAQSLSEANEWDSGTYLNSSLVPYARHRSGSSFMTASAAAFMRSRARRSLGFSNLYLAVNLVKHTNDQQGIQCASKSGSGQGFRSVLVAEDVQSARLHAGEEGTQRKFEGKPKVEQRTYFVNPLPSMRTTIQVLASKISGCSKERTYSYLVVYQSCPCTARCRSHVVQRAW
jgi:hypothetical protein